MSLLQQAQLNSFERLALSIGRLANEPSIGKALQYRFVRTLSYSWMKPSMSRRTFVDNIDWLIPAPTDRGVLFACNHRSFFDSYLYLFSLYCRGAKWPRSLYFPVRSDFFYDSPLGLATNFAVGGGVMYPPIFRDTNKRELNTDAIERVAGYLDAPHSLVGIHPEGKRNKGNPYKLLPAHPGIGQIVLKARPLVVPIFINGVGNDFIGSMKRSFEQDAKRNHPIIVVFGQPVDYEEFTQSRPRAALYKKCADKIMDEVALCGQREKVLRKQITSGEIAVDHSGWLHRED